MKVIKDLVDKIDDELCDAKQYAEDYLYCKSAGEIKFHKYYFDMAQDELRHAMLLHEIAVAKIEQLNQVYTAPESMKEVWNKSHAEYVEKTAWIKKMLEM